jgi:hypothetical protein
MTRLRVGRSGIFVMLFLLFVIALAFVLAPDDAEAQTNPPSSGDWNIYDNTVISNQRVSLPGGLIVYSGGKLTLNNVDLVFNNAGLGGKALRVRNNGELVMSGGTITHSSATSTYRFVIEVGATASLDGVTVSRTWQNPNTQASNLEGGMVIRSHTVTITDCTFTNSERVGIVINNANPTITNSNFTSIRYYSYINSGSNLYRDAYGIVVIDGAPTIKGCTFSDLGEYATAYNDANSYSYIYLRLNGHGIYSLRGAPTIEDCMFNDIARIHASYSNYVYVEKVRRYVRFYFYSQDIRGAIKAVDPLMLEVTNCNFTNNFQGYYYYTRDAYGVYQSDGKSSIKGCSFWSNGGTLIHVRDGDMILRDTEMMDFTNYGAYIWGSGQISVRNLTMNGTMEYRTTRNEYGLYLYNAGGNIDIRELNITFCYRAIWVQDTAMVRVYDSYINNCSKKIYAYGGRVDLYNVSVSRMDIELGWSASEVNIYWKLDVAVTWQNNVPVPEAIVQIFNESEGLLKANKAGADGIMPTITLLQTKLQGTQNSHISIVNSPLKISAYANAITSETYTVTYESNIFFQCIILDIFPPNVEIYLPQDHHAQNFTSVDLRGIAVDVGSGLDGVEVSSDMGEIWNRADGGLQWNISLDLPEGNYELWVRGIDIAGGFEVLTIKNVTIDLTNPWLRITSPTIPKDTDYYTNQTTVTIIGQAEIGSNVYLNGEELATTGGQFFTQLSDQQEGLNTYEVMAVDHVGNRNITMLRIFQDITPPILIIESPPEDFVTNSRVLVISGLTEEDEETKEQDVMVDINDHTVKVENGLFSMPMTLEEGLNVIHITAVDLAKNYKYETRIVTYDITPPDVQMSYPVRDEAVNHSIVVVSGTVGPDVTMVRVNQVLVNIRDGAFAKNFKLSDGENLIIIEVTDAAGNSVERSYSLILDHEPPMLDLLGPSDGTYSTKETVRVEGRTEVGAVVTLDGEEVEVSGGYFSFDAPLAETLPGSQPNVLEIIATDWVGNEAIVTVEVYRDTTSPDFSIYDTSPVTRLDFTNITGAVVDVADVMSLTINDIPVQPNADGYYEAFVPLEMGTNTFVLIAKDAAGNTVAKEVSIDRAPMIVRDDGILGLGDMSWLVLVLFLMIGVAAAMGLLYMFEKRKEVNA